MLIPRQFDTATFYILNGDIPKAKKQLATIYGTEHVQDRLKMELNAVRSEKSMKNIPILGLLKTKPHFKIVMLGVLIFFNQ